MAEQLNYQINIGGNATESVGSLKKQLREAQAEVGALSDKFGATSQQAIQAAKRAAELKDRIGDARALTEAFNPDAKFKALSASLSGVAGGFAAVQGAIGLFGSESKELEKQLLKVQSALALSQGLQSIGESIDSFKQLGAVVQSSTIFMRANAAANSLTAATMKALGIAVDTTSTSFKVLKGAIAATGIGLAVIAIGELISAISSYTSAADKAKEAQDKLNETILKGAEVGYKAEVDFLQRTTELQVSKLKAAGATEEQIFKEEQTGRKARLNSLKRYNSEVSNINSEKSLELDRQLKKEQNDIEVAENNFAAQQLQKRKQRNQEAINEQKRLAQERKQLEEAEQARRKEQDDRESAAQKVQIDAFRATLKQREQDILQAEDELESKRAILIQAGNFDFQKIEEENRIKIAEINAKYDQEELDKQKEIDEKKRDAAEKEVERKKDYEERKRKFELESQQLTEELQSRREQLLLNGLNVLGAIAGENEKIANTIFAIQKGLEIAKVVSSASASIGQIIASTQAIPPILPPGVPNPAYVSAVALGAKRAAIVKVGAAAQIAGIAATSISRFKNGGSSDIGGSVSGQSASAPLSPQAQTTSLSQSSINAIGNSAIRAYVVETDISSNQKRIQAIKQRARFS